MWFAIIFSITMAFLLPWMKKSRGKPLNMNNYLTPILAITFLLITASFFPQINLNGQLISVYELLINGDFLWAVMLIIYLLSAVFLLVDKKKSYYASGILFFIGWLFFWLGALSGGNTLLQSRINLSFAFYAIFLPATNLLIYIIIFNSFSKKK